MPHTLSFVIGIFAGLIFLYFPVFSILMAIIPSIFYLLKRKYFLSFLCLIISLVGLFYGIMEKNSNEKESFVSFKGYVLWSKGDIHLFKTIEGKSFKVYSKEKLEKDRLYQVECKKIAERRNPYFYGKDEFCYASKLALEGNFKKNIFEKVQDSINKELKAKLNEPTSSVMIAMTTGVRYEIPKEVREDFQKTGLVHLLSISGAHFSLLFTFFLLIFKFMIRFIPYKWLVHMTLYIKPSQVIIILCFPILLFYYLIIEPNHPSTRAFIMALFFMLGVLSERRSMWITTVCLACFFILIIDPSSARDLSFQLSFLATVAIGFVTDLYKSFKNRISNKLLSYIILSFLISLSATIITAPLVIYRFQYLSLISPIANLTVGLLIGMVLFPLNIIFVFIYLITGVYPFADIINIMAEHSFRLMHFMSSLSFSSLSIPPIPLGFVMLFYLAIFLSIFSYYGLRGNFKKISFIVSSLLIIITVLISFFLNITQKKSFKITFLDVGQAESSIIETQDGVFLVDTGKTGFEAERYLRAKGYKELQALIITHEQRDHAGGFLEILENFKVREVWDNGYIKYNVPVKVRHLERGDIIKVGSCIFTVLHPYKGFYSSSLSKDSNELSLVFTLKCRDQNFLFTSDTGIEALNSIPLDYLKADIIKIPHHGSKRSFYEEFYIAVSPKICIISVGKDNPYGHPHQLVLEYLRNKCRIYRTDIDGAIQIIEKYDGKIEIKTFEQMMFKPYREWENLKKLFILW
ncbi:MAG: DNA internalization-related competence protein ComEC/Rec2 [Thermodesulfovibrio sp.]|nr:DNA internalization-related competence protein ComEC/Rec2 [Thermodesulfovibrio sp.]